MARGGDAALVGDGGISITSGSTWVVVLLNRALRKKLMEPEAKALTFCTTLVVENRESTEPTGEAGRK